jgi:hypothetical protein
MNLKPEEKVNVQKSLLIHMLYHKCYLNEEDCVKIEPDSFPVKIDKLIPCLDSNLKAKEKKDSDLMSMRVLKDNILIK